MDIVMHVSGIHLWAPLLSIYLEVAFGGKYMVAFGVDDFKQFSKRLHKLPS